MLITPHLEEKQNPSKEDIHMDDLILTQLAKEFKRIIEKIMMEERERYLKEHNETRANGFYTRSPKTILGQMDLSIPRTRDGNFKPTILPERY